MSECVTHHHACECREARLAALEAVTKAAQDVRVAYVTDIRDWKWMAWAQLGLRDALAHLDAVTGGETS